MTSKVVKQDTSTHELSAAYAAHWTGTVLEGIDHSVAVHGADLDPVPAHEIQDQLGHTPPLLAH